VSHDGFKEFGTRGLEDPFTTVSASLFHREFLNFDKDFACSEYST